jgi:hypothetical protein
MMPKVIEKRGKILRVKEDIQNRKKEYLGGLRDGNIRSVNLEIIEK